MTAKDNKLVKGAQTMTAGTTPNKLEMGATITIHGHSVTINHTDSVATLVQYANLSRRPFDTHALNSYLDLGTFPVGSVFERDTGLRNERAVIEAVTGDCCYQVRITTGGELPENITYTYAAFIAWHMDNGTKPFAKLETDVDLLNAADDEDANPFEEELKERVEELQAQPEALQFGDALIADLRAKLKAANEAAEQAEINGQIRINKLQHDVAELRSDLLTQHDQHVTEMLAKNERIQRLEERAAILNPAPVSKDVTTLIQVLHIPEMRKAADTELASKLSEGWTPLHIDVSTEFTIDSDCHVRIVTLVRDLPASPAPKVAATDEAIYSGSYIGTVPLGRPPVKAPPQPQIINMNQPASRPLTNNVSRIPGETKKIPTLADIEARRQKDTEEIDAIIQRGRDQQEALRRQFANQPSPFNRIGAQ